MSITCRNRCSSASSRRAIEETFELVRNRLEASGFDKIAGRRVVLTGGACQLHGSARACRADPRQAGADRAAACASRASPKRPAARRFRPPPGSCISPCPSAPRRRTRTRPSADRRVGILRPLESLAAGELFESKLPALMPVRRTAEEQTGKSSGETRGSPDRTGHDTSAAAAWRDSMINLSIPRDEQELKPRITVVGVGGAGGNAVNNMIRSNLVGCEFIVCNTDAQALQQSTAPAQDPARDRRHPRARRRLAARCRPRRRRGGARRDPRGDARARTWCSSPPAWAAAPAPARRPVIARIARESGILTVGVVTKPFHFEGIHRMRIAEAGHRGTAEIRRHADHHPEPEPVPRRQRADHLRRRLQDGRRRPAFRRARRHRPDGDAGPDQSRLRRHPHGDERDGQGDDGHRRGRGRAPRDRRRRGGDLQPAARGRVDEGRAAAS